MHWTYKTNFEIESYVEMLMSFSWRSSLAKFGTGVAPLRLEPEFNVNQRTCFNCNEMFESHVSF